MHAGAGCASLKLTTFLISEGNEFPGALREANGPSIRELLQAVGLLARDSGDEFEVLIDVKDGESRGFGCRGNEQVRD